ncbi:histone protein transcriptional corepressor [Niveomyces insectorum RCEF 264]|uniref:Histone transcription regulator 3 homolog n=1 Tax=Niveomyces insectorum RCEF 264 TaxID=1081102 RepID=A0A167XYY2_9HYPO|nr:histone protein transcriptional corepressor [Niveomyces insectorum RCEF 264]
MPAFAAINVEPEDDLEDEVEVTRRIQIDDALKLYQTALKLHAQGPKSFPAAKEAYEGLFRSAIFSYPEARTDYERAERQPDPLLTPGPGPSPTFAASLEAAVLDESSSANSLAQAYYIAYKNHGQFLLDVVRHKARNAKAAGGADGAGRVFRDGAVLDDLQKALGEFIAALDRDPSDTELWRRTGRVAAFLQSARIDRYCLEAAIELDDDPAVMEVEPPSLAEGFAGEQLRKQLQALADTVSLSHPIMAPFVKRQMAAPLSRFLDPLPWLPNPIKDVSPPKQALYLPPSEEACARLTVRFKSPSWADLGMAMVQLVAEIGMSGQVVEIDAPVLPDDNQIMQIEIDQQLSGLQEATHTDSEGKLENESKAAESEAVDDEEKAKTNGVLSPEDKDGGGALPEESAEKDRQRDAHKDRCASSQPRKRSQSAAGLPDDDDNNTGDTKRSKRIRRRETIAEEAVDPNTAFANQLQPYFEADQNLFRMTKSVLQKLNVPPIPTLDETIDVCGMAENRIAKLQNHPAKEMRAALITAFKDDRAKILLSKKDTPVLGLDAFLEQTKSGQHRVPDRAGLDEMRGLRAFVSKINSGWYSLEDVAYEWVVFMSQSYMSLRWSDATKRSVVQVLSKFDESLYRRVCFEVQRWQMAGPSPANGVCNLVQMIFELYLDIYERITNPSSAVDKVVRIETKDRLDRWMDLASGLAPSFSEDSAILTFRFLWACVFFTTIAPGVPRDHILACWESLRHFLYEEGSKNQDLEIVLPNNAVISEVSYKAADREISKLTTMDFFLSLFQDELKDPVAVIDKLEPVLNPTSVYTSVCRDVDPEDAAAEAQKPIAECASPELHDMWRFLRGSSTSLRLFLWARLADAYKDIDYATKVFSCYLRCIELIVDDLEAETYLSTPEEPTRRQVFMQLLKTLDEMIIHALSMAVNDSHAFDIVDEDHLRSSASALARISCMLHVATLYEDEVRIGMTSAASNSQTFHALQNKLREMQVRAWSLQYTLIKVGLKAATATVPNDAQSSAAEFALAPASSSSSPSPSESASRSASSNGRDTSFPPAVSALHTELADYLGAIHQVVGLRKFCKASNKIFLRMARSELLRMRGLENWEGYLGQVLYDLHGLKLGAGLSDVQEHGCPTERLERKNALALVDKVMALASGMSMKDLLKSDLKNTIEHMQQAIGQTKSTTQMIHNLRYVTEYLKRPIHPLRLYQAWTGGVELDTVPATTPDLVLARNGWFFLMGMVALTKFKGVDLNRRQTPGATDDLRVGAQYLRLQLQLTPARWDAWFRLAECFDYDLDEAVLWSAERMNKDRGELVKLQRSAIHCYTLALSYWHSDAADGQAEKDGDALHDLYHNFGMRLYASSREPFAMEAFHHAEHERWFIAPDTLSTYKKTQHGEMTDFMVWRYAARLFLRAMALRPRDWKSAYMFSKCCWKMYQKPVDQLSDRERRSHPTMDDVIESLEKSIQVVSLLPKPRHGQDPVLEPHYKMVSIVDKLVRRGDMHAQAAADLLQRQPYAIQQAATVSVTNTAEWESYVIKSLQHLRDKDKSNWQHRMVIRQARMLFGDCDLVDDAAAAAAPVAEEAAKENGTNAATGANDAAEDTTQGRINGAPNVADHGLGGDNARNGDADGDKGTAEKLSEDVDSRNVATKEENAKSDETNDNKADVPKVPDASNGKDTENEKSPSKDVAENVVNKDVPEDGDRMDIDKAVERGDEDRHGSADAANGNRLLPADAVASGEANTNAPSTEDDQEEADRQKKAQAAFAVLRESMFTKTMVMNVWKCDAERPGRHHVFTEQYVRFMTRLLVVLHDRVNMEALLRRIRKKGADFYHFNDLWQTCVISYVRLLRRSYKIPLAVEDVFKSVSPEEFEILSERIAEWVGGPEADHRALSALREAIEIKKLNGNLMKAGPIDELVSDCYSVIFAEVSRSLPGDDPAAIIEERQRQLKEEADKAERAEREKQAEAAASGSSKAAILLSFNLLAERGGGGAADKDSSANGASRAGSEAPGSAANNLFAAERMDRQGSGMGGSSDHPQRRGRAPGVRRPDVLRKAEQAIARLGEPVSKSGAPSAATGGGGGHGGSSGNAGASSHRGADGNGNGGGSRGRRSTRLGSSSSARHDLAMAGAEPGLRNTSKDGDGSGADGEEGDDDAGAKAANRDGSGRGRTRSTQSKTRRRSLGLGRDDDGPHGRDMRGTRSDGDGVDSRDDGGDGDGDGGSEASSPSGSVHDSADDESELSDVPPDYEEDVPPSLMFPNLRKSEEAAVATRTIGEDGEEEEDEEEEEEEDEDEDRDEGEDEAEAEEENDNDDEHDEEKIEEGVPQKGEAQLAGEAGEAEDVVMEDTDPAAGTMSDKDV